MAERSEDVRMTIGEHIEELRKRILYALYAFFAVFMGTFVFHDAVREFALRPNEEAVEYANQQLRLKHAREGRTPQVVPARVVMGPGIELPPGISPDAPQGRLVVHPLVTMVVLEPELVNAIEKRATTLSPQELVFQDVKLSMLVALLFSAPFLIFQIWAFVRAGLYENERRAIGPYLPIAIGLFVAGAAFGYEVMLPMVLRALIGWNDPDKIVIQNRLQEYLSLFYTFTFALGALFQVPIAMMMVARIGLVTARGFLRAWRWAVLIGVVTGAVLNPAPDIVTQLLFAAPIVGLFFAGVVLALWAERKRAEKPPASA